MKRYLLLLMSVLPFLAGAQFRYADTVVAFSSQWSSGSWSGAQALGAPNTFPSCGDIASAWAPSTADGAREWIELGFSGAAPVNRIRIYETSGPGAIDTIYIWNPVAAAWVMVDSQVATARSCPNIKELFMPRTTYSVTRIRLAINAPAVTGWNEIDAVSIGNISDSGIIGYSQQICNNYYRPDSLISIDSAFQDSIGVVYRWQLSYDSISWASISGATALGYWPDTSSVDRFFRRRAIHGTDTVYSNVVSLKLPAIYTPGLPGDSVWMIYGFNGTDIALNRAIVNARGFYTDSTLSFNTGADWNGSYSPSYAPNWKGCPVNSDNHSVQAVRRTFEPGFYTFQMPYHDDAATAFKNGQPIFYTGGCCGTSTVFNIGYLGRSDTLDARYVEGGGAAGMQVVLTKLPLQPGAVSAAQGTVCLGDATQLYSTAGASGGAGDMFGASYHYQWQDSLAGGAWTSISGATAATYQVAAMGDTLRFFRRRVSDDSGYAATSNVVALRADSLRGDPSVWGQNEWRFYAYAGRDINLNPANVQYRGYYTDTALNFATNSVWNEYQSPAAAPGYRGCPLPTDNFSMSIKRIGFPAGPYVLSFPLQDDDIRVFRNGVQFLTAGCCNTNPFTSLGLLGPNDTLEFRYTEDNGPAYLSSFLRIQQLDGGQISGAQDVCGSEHPETIGNQLSASGGAAPWSYVYEWQDSISGGSWIPVPAAAAPTFTPDTIRATHSYRRKVSDSTGAWAYSNIVVKRYTNTAGNPADTGNGVWNVYCYNGTDAALVGNTYRGYFIDSGFNIGTAAQHFGNNGAPSDAPGYQGCLVSADYFTTVWRRRGFPAGSYTLSVNHDDYLEIRKNGQQIYAAGCCPTNGVSIGFLNADSVLEFRLVEYGGAAYLNAAFTKTDSAIAAYRNTACNNFSLVNVAGPNWWDFTDDSGHIVLSLNPNGNNLGTVTVSMKHYGQTVAAVPLSGNGAKYMQRYFNLESGNYPAGLFPSPVSVRLYFKDSELDSFRAATSLSALTASALRIYHYDGVNEDCDILNDNGPIVGRTTTATTYTGSGFYLETLIPSFSELGATAGSIPLPIGLVDFSVQRAGPVAKLQWELGKASAAQLFRIERSADGISFSQIAELPAVSGLTGYQFPDPAPLPGRSYYRLLIRGRDGAESRSPVRTLDMGDRQQGGDLAVYPNPARETLFIRSTWKSTLQIRILNSAGMVVGDATGGAGEGSAAVGLKPLPAGIYMLQVHDDAGHSWHEQVEVLH